MQRTRLQSWQHAHTNLLPFRFRHPKLIMAQKEGPHSLPDLVLDPTVVDQPQQLLVLVTLCEELHVSTDTGSAADATSAPAWPPPAPTALPQDADSPTTKALSDPHLGLSTARSPLQMGIWGFTGPPQPQSSPPKLPKGTTVPQESALTALALPCCPPGISAICPQSVLS